jgi:hypothetical protein
MATSGTSAFATSRDYVVRRALRLVGAYTSTDNPRPEQLVDATYALNVMLKAWSIQGLLWLREFYSLSLVVGQNQYPLGAGTPVTPIDRPLHIYSATRKTVTGGAEVPLIQLTRTDWMAIPNKTTLGVPNQFYYDNQTLTGQLYIWPTPDSSTTYSLVLDIDKQLDIMRDNIDDFDFPPQWIEAITYGLAAKISGEYGMSIGEATKLKEDAGLMFNSAITDDRDLGSVQFGVRR